MGLVKKQFFPQSDRPELLVEVTLPQGTSIEATNASSKKVEEWLRLQPEAKIVTAYIGAGAPRYNPEESTYSTGEPGLGGTRANCALVLDQARLQLIGLSSHEAAEQIQFLLTGAPVTQVREDIRTAEVIARRAGTDRIQ